MFSTDLRGDRAELTSYSLKHIRPNLDGRNDVYQRLHLRILVGLSWPSQTDVFISISGSGETRHAVSARISP